MKIVVSLIILFIFTSFIMPDDFLAQQKKYERVREAFTEKEKIIINQLKSHGLQVDNLHIIIVAYKDEDVLEIFAKKKSEKTYKKLIAYPVCKRSGQLGPKRKSGDSQVPEGFYQIDRYNPASSYYLSLGLNYPNSSDRLRSNAKDLGGDIFIHGACVTIGCLPMTDDKIKEIYLYAIHARNNGQLKIPVYVFPFRMTDDRIKKYSAEYDSDNELLSFWKNIKSGFDKFEREHAEISYTVNMKGEYEF